MSEPLIGSILSQPFVEVLFRPEEIVDRSAASLLDVDGIGIEIGDLSVVHPDFDPIAAVGAGVKDGELLVVVFVAVDQQQEVDCSPQVEGLFPFDLHGVEVVAQRSAKNLVAVGQRVVQLVVR